jgi:hypothetical protein
MFKAVFNKNQTVTLISQSIKFLCTFFILGMNSPPVVEQTELQKVLTFLQTKVFPVPDVLVKQLEAQGESVIEDVWMKYSKDELKEIAGVAGGITIYKYLHPETDGILFIYLRFDV